ncbi:MAG: glycosyltransferase family 4 protein [Actinomycetota bacterium]|nr:glycosyltransferase family 4 protein [Actinomycetota bacterium]
MGRRRSHTRERRPIIHVLLTHPFFWPHVVRGAEREVHDTGMRLAERGHRIDLVTGKPTGVTSVADVDGVHVRYVRTPLPAWMERRGWRRESTFGAVAALGAATSRADVVASFLYADSYGASLASRLPLPSRHGRPVVLKLTGAVLRSRVDDQPIERGLLRRALDTADQVWVNSRFVLESMADWGYPMHVLPVGLDERTFHPVAERSEHPLVLCTAAPHEPRKRLVDLLDAWAAVREGLPGAELVITQRTDAETRASLLERVPASQRDSVRFSGLLTDAELAAMYSRAWVMVAPSVYEAFGLMTVEALACGTPVAGCDSGATPELLDQPGTGTLFPPADPDALAEAVVAASRLAQEPGIRERCRAAALRYAWPRIIDEIEQRLTMVVEARR